MKGLDALNNLWNRKSQHKNIPVCINPLTSCKATQTAD